MDPVPHLSPAATALSNALVASAFVPSLECGVFDKVKGEEEEGRERIGCSMSVSQYSAKVEEDNLREREREREKWAEECTGDNDIAGCP